MDWGNSKRYAGSNSRAAAKGRCAPPASFENGVGADSDVVGDDTGFVYEVGDGGGEHGVAAGDFPVLLEHHGEGQPVLPDLGPVLLRLSFADYHDFQLRVLAVELLKLRRERDARATARAGEDQQHPPAAQAAQRQRPASVQPWQAEIRGGRAGFQAVPFDFAPGQRTAP